MSAGEPYVKKIYSKTGPAGVNCWTGFFGCRFRREARVRGWWEVEGWVRVWYNVEVWKRGELV